MLSIIAIISLSILFVGFCCFENAIIETLSRLEKEVVREEHPLMAERRLPKGTIDAWAEGIECQMFHEFPMYWPKG